MQFDVGFTSLTCDHCELLKDDGVKQIAKNIKILSCHLRCGLRDLSGFINCTHLSFISNENITDSSLKGLGKGLTHINASYSSISDTHNFIDCEEFRHDGCKNINEESLKKMPKYIKTRELSIRLGILDEWNKILNRDMK